MSGPETPPEPHRPAGLRGARALYASGSFGFNILQQTMALWLIYFYAPPPDSGRPTIIPLTLLGLLLTVSRTLEAFDDPLIGHWSDVTRSPWGGCQAGAGTSAQPTAPSDSDPDRSAASQTRRR